MTKILSAILLIALSPALALAGQASAPQAAAVVTNSVENMFRNATDDSRRRQPGSPGRQRQGPETGKERQGRRLVPDRNARYVQGWVVASSLRFLKPGDKPYASAGKVFVVSALMANTYREPDVTAHKPVKVAPISAVLEIVGEKGERWLEVALPGGSRAWIQKGDGDVREAPWSWPPPPVADIVALSKRFIGVPYTWGGTSPLGLDCSGFVQLVYKMNGIPILRDADIQMTKSGLVEVPKGSEQAGDLVFFGGAIDRISHVGMMIDAENFINATVYLTPCVRIDNLKVERWAKIYQAVRRPK